MTENEEIEIDLLDVLGRILIRWKTCLLFAMAFSVILNAKQQTILADAGSRSDTVTAFEKKINESLNEKQQTYFRQEKMRDETEETKADSDRRWLKYSGIGFILGAFIFACIMLILYMTGDKVRTINEAESMFGTRCLQSVTLSEIKASRADIIKKWVSIWLCGKEIRKCPLMMLFAWSQTR